MHIFVKLLSGKTLSLPTQPETTICQVKRLIGEREKIPVDSQRLIYQATQLEDEHTLQQYNIINDSTLHLVLRLVAGTTQKTPLNTIQSVKPHTATKTQALTENALSKQQQQQHRILPPTILHQQIPQPQFFFNNSQGLLPTHLLDTKNIPLINKNSGNNCNSSEKASDNNDTQHYDKKNSPSKGEESQKNQAMPNPLTLNNNKLTNLPIKKELIQDFAEPARKKPKRNKRGQYTKRACTHCRLAHAACDEGRPCKRCISLGKESQCRDAERKRSRKKAFDDKIGSGWEYSSNNLADFIPLLGSLGDDEMNDDSDEDYDDDEEEDEEVDLKSEEQSTKNETKISVKEEKNALSPSKDFEQTNVLSLFNQTDDQNLGRSLLDDDDNVDSSQNVPQLFHPTEFSNSEYGLGSSLMSGLDTESSPSPSTSVIPFNQSNACISSTGGNDQVLQQLMVAYAKQAQELKELKELVRHLQGLVISSVATTSNAPLAVGARQTFDI